MPESTPSPLDQAEQLVAQGKLKQALDRLQPALRRQSGLHRDAVSLRSRLHTLNRQVTQGVIDREDESLERSRIVQGVLDIIEQAKSSQISATTPKTSDTPPTPWRRRRWIFGILGLGVLIAIVWSVRTLQPISVANLTSPANPFTLELQLRLVSTGDVTPEDGSIAASLGKLPLPLKSWEPGRTLRYPGIDAIYRGDSLQIELNGWPYRYRIRTLTDRFAASVRRITLALEPETKIFSGVVVTSNDTPIPQAELIFDGQFRTITDQRGRYEIELPLSSDGLVRVEIHRNDRILEPERRLGQRAAILAELKARLPDS